MNVQFGAAHHPKFGETPTQRISRLADLRCQEYFSRPENRPGKKGDGDQVVLTTRTASSPKPKKPAIRGFDLIKFFNL